MKIKSVKYNLIMNMILKMSQFLFPLITFPYISRILLAEGNGKIAFATSVAYYFTTFASLGIPTHGIKICAQNRDNKEELSRITQELILINVITVIISYLVFSILMCTVKRFQEENILLWICSLQLVLTMLGAEWFFQAIEQYDYITFRNIIFKIVSIILMFVFVHNPSDYIIYGAITLLGTCGSNILNFFRLHKYIFMKPVGHYNFKRHWKPIFTFFMLTVATTVYTNLDTVMLGFIKDNAQVGFYNAATKMKGILLGIVTALGTVLLPRISYYIQKGKIKEFKSSIRKSFQFVWMIALPIMCYFIVESKAVILFLAGTGYENAIMPMQIIMPTIIFIGLSNITGIQILVPLGEEKYTVLSTISGAVVNLILNTVLIPKFGASGAALGTLIAEITVLFIQIRYAKKWMTNTIDIKDFTKVFFATVLSCLILIVFKNIISVNSFIELILTAGIFFFLYGIGLIILKEVIVMEILFKMKEMIKQ